MKTLETRVSLRSAVRVVAQILASPIAGIVAGAIAGMLVWTLWWPLLALFTFLGILSDTSNTQAGVYFFGLFFLAYFGLYIGLPIGTVLGISYGAINQRAGRKRGWLLIAGLSSGLATALVTREQPVLVLLDALIGVLAGAIVTYLFVRVFGREVEKTSRRRRWIAYLISIPSMTFGIYVMLRLWEFSA